MHQQGIPGNESEKPEIIEFYNLTKGGVNVPDKLCHDKTTKRKSRRYFFGVLKIAAVNSFVLAKWNSGQDKFTSQARNNFLKNYHWH